MVLFRFWRRETLGRLSNAILMGALIGAVGGLVVIIPAGEELEERFGLHWLFGARGSVAPPSDVVIVAIDEQSARDLGLKDRPSTWPRGLHAELVRYVARAGASVVTFDLTFDTPGGQPDQDQEFADAIRSAGNVLLAESMRRETLHLPGTNGQSAVSAVIESRLSPVHVLEQAALGSAPFMLPKDSRVDTYWTFLDDARTAPTLPVLTFQVFGSDTFQDFASLVRKGDQSGLSIPRSRRSPSSVAASAIGDTIAVLQPHELAGSPRAREHLSGYLRGASAVATSEHRRRLVSSLLGLYSAPESRYLNFYGPPRTIATVSYSKVLEAARSAASAANSHVSDVSFKGKAVFVGYAAATPGGQDRLRDDYRTVYSRADGLDLSGVEIAATAFANLVDGRALQPIGLGGQLAIVVVWGLVLGLICRLMRPVFATLVVVAISSGYLWVVLERFVDAALWLPSINPIGVQAPLALFAGVWFNYRDTKREREVIRRAFGFFLPSAVVDRLTRSLGPMTSTNQVVFGACLSTDAEKYTSLAERTEPGRLGELMNDYYAQMFVPVERSNGVVADVVGDSMVAVWARTSTDVDVRRSACGAALVIAKALENFNADSGDRPPLLTRFGLHSGDMMFGTIGASGHFEYRAVGDIVNTASRLQGLNKVLGTRILASAESVQGLEEFVVRPLGSFLLAGKANAVSVVELIGTRDDVDTRDSGLHREFAGALEAFADRRWRTAADAFTRILESDPDDGPAHFYAAHCEGLELSPPEGAWTPTIRIDSK